MVVTHSATAGDWGGWFIVPPNANTDTRGRTARSPDRARPGRTGLSARAAQAERPATGIGSGQMYE
jgi:hypothetical protein